MLIYLGFFYIGTHTYILTLIQDTYPLKKTIRQEKNPILNHARTCEKAETRERKEKKGHLSTLP